MTAEEALAEMLAHNYGTCLASTACKCLKTGWLGTGCPNWRPLQSKTYADMIKEMSFDKDGS